MNVFDLLKELTEKKVSIRELNGNLKIDFPEDLYIDDLLGDIRENKTELVDLLSNESFDNYYTKPEGQESYIPHHAHKRLYKFCKGNSVYHIKITLKCYEQLDNGVMEFSFKKLIERHEILRTNFIEDGNEIRLSIKDTADFSIHFEDLTESGYDSDQLIGYLSVEEPPFDLQRDLLLKVRLLKLGEAEFILQVVIEHLIIDQWGIGVLFKQLFGIYNQVTTLEPYPRLQYREALRIQRNLFEHLNEKNEEFWMAKFADKGNTLNLPYNYPRPPKKTFEGDIVFASLDPAESKLLLSFCKEQHSTLFVTYIAMVNILLSQKCGQRDIITGVILAERYDDMAKEQLGYFLNNLPLRFNIDANMNYPDIINQVKTGFWEHFTHKDYSFSTLVEKLGLSLDAARHPIFDVLIYEENDFFDATELHGLRYDVIPLKGKKYCKYDLIFNIKKSDVIEFSISYNIHLFNKVTVSSFLSALVDIARCTSDKLNCAQNPSNEF